MSHKPRIPFVLSHFYGEAVYILAIFLQLAKKIKHAREKQQFSNAYDKWSNVFASLCVLSFRQMRFQAFTGYETYLQVFTCVQVQLFTHNYKLKSAMHKLSQQTAHVLQALRQWWGTQAFCEVRFAELSVFSCGSIKNELIECVNRKCPNWNVQVHCDAHEVEYRYCNM